MEHSFKYIPQALIALYAVCWVSLAFWAPKYFWCYEWFNDDKEISKLQKWKIYGRMAAIFFGLFIIMYHASYSFLQWIPESWRSDEDDAPWKSVREYIQYLFGFFTAFCIIPVVHQRLMAAALRPVDYQVLLALASELDHRPHSNEAVEEYRQSLMATARIAAGKAGSGEGYGIAEHRKKLVRFFTSQ